ncbi:hypothetical protein WN944_024022 [Citrus x changshan-huyou]|uniref:Uncharacterized protein n=1 Tax=Citrus x changshan-huyou TaxID=2935761 RepID=A0AAP0LMW7_9ROSI
MSEEVVCNSFKVAVTKGVKALPDVEKHHIANLNVSVRVTRSLGFLSMICKEASEFGNSLALPPSLSQLVTYQLKILQIISGFKQPSMTALIQLLRLTAR